MAQQQKQDWSSLALIGAGIILVTATVGGYFIGQAVDKALGTAPRWAMVGLIVGTVVGFYDLYLIASRIMRGLPPLPRQAPPDNESDEALEAEGDRDNNHEM